MAQGQRRLPAGSRDQAVTPEQHHKHQDQTEDQFDRLRQVDLLHPVAVHRGTKTVDPVGQVLQEPRLQQLQRTAPDHTPATARAARRTTMTKIITETGKPNISGVAVWSFAT